MDEGAGDSHGNTYRTSVSSSYREARNQKCMSQSPVPEPKLSLLNMDMKKTGRENVMAKKSINGRATSFCLAHVYALAIRLHLKTIMRNRRFPCRPQRYIHPKHISWAGYKAPALRHLVRMKYSKLTLFTEPPAEMRHQTMDQSLYMCQWLTGIHLSKVTRRIKSHFIPINGFLGSQCDRMKMPEWQMAELKAFAHIPPLSLARFTQTFRAQSQNNYIKTEKDIFYSGAFVTDMDIWVILRQCFGRILTHILKRPNSPPYILNVGAAFIADCWLIFP